MLALCLFLTIGAWGFLQPLAVLYLQASGLNSWQIGVVTGAGTGIAFALQPLWGRLSDALDKRRPFMFASAIGAGTAYLAFRFADSVWAFTLLTALGVNAILYMNAAVGTLCGRLAPRHEGGALYASVRIWGSIGYVLVALVMGIAMQRVAATPGGLAPALSRAQLEPAFTYGPLLFFALALATLFVTDLPAPGREDAQPAPFVVTPQMRAFLIAFFLYNFALNGMLAYLSLYLKQLGAAPLWITGVWAAGVFMEILMMSQSGQLSDRFGRRPLLLIPFLVLPLRLLLLVPASGALWVLPVQMLEGLGFGIIGTVSVAFVNDLAPARSRGSAQGLLFATMGLAMALAPLVGGAISQAWNIRAMFAIMAVVAALGALVFWRFVGESHPVQQAGH